MPALSAESEKTGLKHRFRWLIAFTNLRSLGHKMRFELKKKFSWSYRAGQKCSNSIQEGSFPRFEELPTEIRVMIVSSCSSQKYLGGFSSPPYGVLKYTFKRVKV